MEHILKHWKEGTRDYKIVKILMEAGGDVVPADKLIYESLNKDKVERIILLKTPEIRRLEVNNIKLKIQYIRKILKTEDFDIVWDKGLEGEKGYRMTAL